MTLKPSRLLILSLDSLSRQDLPLLGKLPHFSAFMEEAARVESFKSVYPSETYPAHSSFITGTFPAEHGILANTQCEPGEQNPMWHWWARDIKTKTLYQQARQEGLRTALLLWPVAGKARASYLFPEIMPIRKGEKYLPLMLKNGTPGWLLRMALRYGSLLKGDGRQSLDRFSTALARRLILKKKAAFLALHWHYLDHLKHEQGADAEARKACLKEKDQQLGTLLEALEKSGEKDKTCVVLFGDHGHKNVSAVIHPNTILWQADPRQRGWCNACGGSSHVYLMDHKSSEARRFCENLFDSWKSQGLLRYWNRAGEEFPGVDYVLEAAEGYYFDNAAEGPLLEKNPSYRSVHGYAPDLENYSSLFMAAGPGLKPGARVSKGHITEAAPFLAQLMGWDFPVKQHKWGSLLS